MKVRALCTVFTPLDAAEDRSNDDGICASRHTSSATAKDGPSPARPSLTFGMAVPSSVASHGMVEETVTSLSG